MPDWHGEILNRIILHDRSPIIDIENRAAISAFVRALLEKIVLERKYTKQDVLLPI